MSVISIDFSVKLTCQKFFSKSLKFSTWRDSTDEERDTSPILYIHDNRKGAIEIYALIKLYPNNIFYTDRLRRLNQCDMALLKMGIQVTINYNKAIYKALWRVEYKPSNKEDNYQLKFPTQINR